MNVKFALPLGIFYKALGEEDLFEILEYIVSINYNVTYSLLFYGVPSSTSFIYRFVLM